MVDEKIVSEVINIIKNAGGEILNIYNQDLYSVFKKNDNSPVTRADIASDKIIINSLKKFKYPILSEESKDDLKRLKSKRVWVVDSLDGTLDFIKKTNEFSIMIGLIDENKPILGAVYLPYYRKLYYAIDGVGSFLEENNTSKKIKVSSINNIEKSKIVMSRNHLKPEDKARVDAMKINNLIKSGSNGIKIGLIAEGKADIFFNTTSKMCLWDSCAPEIILKEAGGKITDIYGNLINYNIKNVRLENGLIATNGILHKEVINNI